MTDNISYLLFYDPKEKLGIFSNFYQPPNPLKILDKRTGIVETWITSEHYFQAMKFRGKNATPRSIEYSNLIKIADSPMKCKILARQRKDLRWGKNWVLNKCRDKRLVNDIVDLYSDVKFDNERWNRKRIQVMAIALIAKFFDNPKLKQQLIDIPDNTILVEHTRKDCVWGDGGDGGTGAKGTNYLGKILTILHYIFKYENCDRLFLNKELLNRLSFD